MASVDSPIFVIDDDPEEISDSDDEVQLLDYGIDTPEPEIITIEDDDEEVLPDQKLPSRERNTDIRLPEIEDDFHILPGRVRITPGCTVELKDRARSDPEKRHSGDFLRIKHIIRNVRTDEVKLRGFRLRRTKYLGPIWEWRSNELVLVLHVDENETGSPFVRGMIDIPISKVFRVRECILTNKDYPALSFRQSNPRLPSHVRSDDDVKTWIFHKAQLVCRSVNILFLHENGKPYSGEVRRLHPSEVDPQHAISSKLQRGYSKENSVEVGDDDEDQDDDWARAHADAANNLRCQPRARPTMPVKKLKYKFADCFCGAGGASQGAEQADLTVYWGFDHDDIAIRAYQKNHIGALPYTVDAHHFPPEGADLAGFNIDILHLSPPCCFWSPAHTRAGKHDQANYESIYTVGPILEKIQPRVAILEQTFGLATYQDHKNNFLLLLNTMITAEYNVQYKIINMAAYGLPQERKRLIVIAARIGTPLPPFPKPTHGSRGIGLKRYVSVADALQPLERFGSQHDLYHQPGKSKLIDKPPYDPRTKMLEGCVTTSGGQNNFYHTGKRKFTPRELSLFQSFPLGYQFTGTRSNAIKQIGNAFPPIVAEAVYRTAAKTLEAFDNGLVSSEDIIDDIDAFLEDKGIEIPEASPDSPYRYLTRNNNSSRATRQAPQPSIFSRGNHVEPERTSDRRAFPTMLPFRATMQRRRVQEGARLAEEAGSLMVVD